MKDPVGPDCQSKKSLYGLIIHTLGTLHHILLGNLIKNCLYDFKKYLNRSRNTKI